MKKEYMAPQLYIERIVPDTSISSCISGDCGYTGEQVIACAEEQSMVAGSYRQDNASQYTFCVDWICE